NTFVLDDASDTVSKEIKLSATQVENEGINKAEANFEVSGKLAADNNTVGGVLINYTEPKEARIPKTKWRLYEFKGDKNTSTLYIHRQSAYLIGRDRKVVDFPADHPSCSKQHAVIQYRLVDYTKEDGRKGKKVKPYIIDLDSTNGTFVNNHKIDPSRYVEVKEKDVIKFGFSTREYVLLHESSKDDDSDFDNNVDTP
ncbi:PREDICTED: smad nuclear-interacting protein 1-like, partial [Amphimedon queenslandica]|uniref:FHA domain-containing protein n=1 Tax=Amphimedon queenslandica TaxID=400682 RepID=A0AAN0K5C0_AMPQE